MNQPIEQLNELPAPPVVIPPCDVKFFTVGYRQTIGWSGDWHVTLKQAHAEAEYCVPGTLRIFEIPKEEKYGD